MLFWSFLFLIHFYLFLIKPYKKKLFKSIDFVDHSKLFWAKERSFEKRIEYYGMSDGNHFENIREGCLYWTSFKFS